LQDPSKYDKFRRTKGGKLNNKIEVPDTISIIWGHPTDAKPSVFVAQALRFPTKDWKEAEAKKWIKDNDVKGTFEAASNKESLKDKVGRVKQVIKEEEFKDLMQQFAKAVEDKYGEGAYYVSSVSREYLLLRRMLKPGEQWTQEYDDEYYKQDWKFTNDDVELPGDPVQVRRVVTYV
jgi:hypothetical protein